MIQTLVRRPAYNPLSMNHSARFPWSEAACSVCFDGGRTMGPGRIHGVLSAYNPLVRDGFLSRRNCP